MSEEKIAAALDIGSALTRVVIAKYEKNGRLTICGWGVLPTAGLVNGTVVNNEEVVKIIQITVETAERQAVRKVDSIIVSLGGFTMQGQNHSGGTPVSGKNREVSKRDIDNAIETASAVPVPMDRRIVRIYVVKFSVDGQKNIPDPISTIGMRLDAYIHMVTASTNEIEGVVHAVERSGYKIMDSALGIEATANAVLTEREKDRGTLLVNIGFHKTEYQVIKEKSPCMTGSIPIGGFLVTSDLADGFEISMAEAERIKKEMGSCIMETSSDRTVTVAAGTGRHEYKSISSAKIIQIVAPRMEELLELIKQEIYSTITIPQFINSVVLTGGGAQIRGAVSLAMRVFNLPVREAGPKASYSVPDACRNPEWSTVIGLLTMGITPWDENDMHREQSGDFRGIVKNFFQWLKRFF